MRINHSKSAHECVYDNIMCSRTLYTAGRDNSGACDEESNFFEREVVIGKIVDIPADRSIAAKSLRLN